jgi:hypothetical protein
MGFEDLRRSFEGSASIRTNGGPQVSAPRTNTKASDFSTSYPTQICVSDFEEELLLFLEEVSNTIVKDRETSIEGELHDEYEYEIDMGQTIKREVLRAEIRTIACRLREHQTPEGAPSSSAQRTTIASLKRNVKEATDNLERVRKEKKLLEIDNRELTDEIQVLLTKVSDLQKESWALENDRGELESKVDLAQHTVNALKVDRKRLESYVGNLRTEIVEYQSLVSEREMQEKQARRYTSELEYRILEMRKVESALMERVYELVETQRETLEEMKRVIDSRDYNGARRVLAKMNTRGASITVKINSLLRRHENVSNNSEQVREPPISPSRSMTSDHQAEQVSLVETEARIESTTAASSINNAESRSVKSTATTKTNIFFRISKRELQSREAVTSGNQNPFETRPIFSRIGRQKAYETSLEKTREGAERNAEALREVVVSKNAEIQRLEEELKAASEVVARLEMDRFLETRKHRKENRNLHVDEKADPFKKREQLTKQRVKPQSLFDWQDFEEDGNQKVD